MNVRFTVLGSGSQGNASLLQVDGFGILIDTGFGPRQLTWRMRLVSATWNNVHAALLTHTHSDHRNERTLAQLHSRRIPLHCHLGHQRSLQFTSQSFHHLRHAKLVRSFQAGEPFPIASGILCTPLPIQHDGGATFGFRLDGQGDLFSGSWSIAYATDLGTWDETLADALADVDVLALEFNHDVELQRTSGRPDDLIERVLGDHGHLSNEQAADLLAAVVQRSKRRPLRHVVLLHLSQECNEPNLARSVALRMLEQVSHNADVHVSCQDEPGPCVELHVPAMAWTA